MVLMYRSRHNLPLDFYCHWPKIAFFYFLKKNSDFGPVFLMKLPSAKHPPVVCVHIGDEQCISRVSHIYKLQVILYALSLILDI